MNKHLPWYSYAEYKFLCRNFIHMEEYAVLAECIDDDKSKFHPGIIMELCDIMDQRYDKLYNNQF